MWKTSRIHHEYSCGIRKYHLRSEYFCQGQGLPSPWSKYSSQGWVSLSHIDTHVGLFFSQNYSKNMKFMCFLTKFESISRWGNIWCHYMILIVMSRGVRVRWIYPTLLSTTAEQYPTVPVMGENWLNFWWRVW